jgi:PAS domain S-box-containing protein
MGSKPRKNSPEAMRELILQSHLELSNSGITVIDKNESIIFWNNRFLELWGLSKEDFEGHHRSNSVNKVIEKIVDPEAFQAILAQAYSDQDYQGVDIIELKDGTHIERKTKSLTDSDRSYYGRVWYFTDITKQKKREQQYQNYTSELQRMVSSRTQELIEAERMAASGTLASEIAHDLRSPLQSIRNAAFMIKRDSEKVEVGLEIIEKSVLRSLEMLEAMRSSTRKSEPTLERSNLNQIIKDAVAELPKPENVMVQLELDNVEEAWIDASHIRRVLDNVLLNAVESMPEGGAISVTKHFVEGKFIIQIADTGVGIPEEVLPNLFERKFYTTKPHGLGLGLSYCKRTVESHGGNIMVDSVLGKGTIFTIEIPLIA